MIKFLNFSPPGKLLTILTLYTEGIFFCSVCISCLLLTRLCWSSLPPLFPSHVCSCQDISPFALVLYSQSHEFVQMCNCWQMIFLSWFAHPGASELYIMSFLLRGCPGSSTCFGLYDAGRLFCSGFWWEE